MSVVDALIKLDETTKKPPPVDPAEGQRRRDEEQRRQEQIAADRAAAEQGVSSAVSDIDAERERLRREHAAEAAPKTVALLRNVCETRRTPHVEPPPPDADPGKDKPESGWEAPEWAKEVAAKGAVAALKRLGPPPYGEIAGDVVEGAMAELDVMDRAAGKFNDTQSENLERGRVLQEQNAQKIRDLNQQHAAIGDAAYQRKLAEIRSRNDPALRENRDRSNWSVGAPIWFDEQMRQEEVGFYGGKLAEGLIGSRVESLKGTADAIIKGRSAAPGVPLLDPFRPERLLAAAHADQAIGDIVAEKAAERALDHGSTDGPTPLHDTTEGLARASDPFLGACGAR